METERLPWLFAILTAGWFGWMANRSGRSWALWATGGAAFGLVVSTLVLGLGQAVSIPYSDHAVRTDRLKPIGAAVVLIVVIGWMLSSSLHRHHLLLLRKIKSAPGPAPVDTGLNPGATPQIKPPTRPNP